MPVSKNDFLLFLFVLFSCGARAQHAEQYSFTHYGLSDGLASNIVNNIVQDHRGFIWLSTNNGLQRFDGNKFITFRNRVGDRSTLPSDEINKLYQDQNNNLWILTADNKIGTFNTLTFTYREVPVKKNNNERIYVDKTLLETADGRLLLHYRKTRVVFEYNPASQSFEPSNRIRFPAYWDVNQLYRDDASNKYFFATDSGFAIFNPKSGNLNYAGANADNEPLIEQYGKLRFVNHVFIDAKKRLFFEQWPEKDRHPVLHVFDPVNQKKEVHNLSVSYGLGYHQIKAVLEQQNGKLWVFGLPFLAEYMDGARPLHFLKKDYSKEKDLKFNQVFSMYEDRQNNIWVCTDHGLYLYNPDAQLFHNYTLTTPKRFAVEGRSQAALQLPGGEIWIGYRDLGLHRYDRNINPLPLPASLAALHENQSVWDLHLHSKTGKLWIALQGGTLMVYDTATGKTQQMAPPPFERRAITQIAEDGDGNLWFGTQAGNIVRWDLKKGLENPAEGFALFLHTGTVEKLFTDRRGHIWIAAVGGGVMEIDPHTSQVMRQISKENKAGFNLWNNHPKDILQYNDSLLVVASGALNLININNYRVQHISNADGLPTNTVQSVARDGKGMLWLGTLNGLCVADVNNRLFTVYNEDDGLLNDHFSAAGAHNLQNDQLLFMSAESFLVFDPSQTRKRDNTSNVMITDFRLWNNSLPVDSLLALNQINLSYKSFITIEFSALNYNKLNKLEYYYQLEGLDTTWIRSDDRHQAIYSFLPPGSYTFKLRTKNVEGVWSPETTFLKLRVTPPFYKSWWFVVLLAVLVLLVLYLVYRERIRRLVTLHNIRSDIADHLHRDVSSTLNNINVLSQIAKMKADRDIDRSKELIDEISGKSYNMMVSMDEILWSIDPSNDTMEKTLLRLKEFAKTLEANFSSRIEIIVHEKVKILQLDMRVRHEFFIIAKAVLQHLAQHSNGKHIIVDIDLAWSKILLKVLSADAESEENRPAMLELKRFMEEKAAVLHANLVFETGKRDTSIVLSIPVKPFGVTPYTIFSSKK